MNTKRIWMMSLILGIMVAVIAYVTLFAGNTATPTSSDADVGQREMDGDQTDDGTASEEEVGEIPIREKANPIAEITEGKRAVSILVATVPGVSGYVEPNSMVDVVAYETTKETPEGATKEKEFKAAVLILENVKVLASGKAPDTADEALRYEMVTLEVTPEEGVMLSLASKDKDGFYLMLRNEEDTATGKKGYAEKREVIKDDEEGE